MNKSDKNSLLLGVIDCVYTISRLFCDVFLLAYLLKVSKDNFAQVGFYWLGNVCAMVSCSFFFRNWLKNGREALLYRLGILMNFGLFGWLSLMGGRVSAFMFVTGCFMGFSMSLRGLGRILLTKKNISDGKMIKFRGYLETVKSFIRIVISFLMGWFLIQSVRFEQALLLISVFLAVEFVLSFFLVCDTTKNQKTHFIRFMKKYKNDARLMTEYKMDFFSGLTVRGILPIAMTLYTAYLFGDDFSLGSISSVAYLCVIVVNFLFGRFVKYQNCLMFSKICGTTAIACALLFNFWPNKGTFLVYNFSYVTVTQFMWLLTEVNMYNVANLKEIQENNTEYFIGRELFLGLGKFIGTGLFILAGQRENRVLLNMFLLMLTCGMIVTNLYVMSLNKKLFSSKKQD
jgi:hypothetical protein